MSDLAPATGTDTTNPPVPAPPATADIEAPPEPKPTETVEFWKQKAREQEARAKSNHEAAQRLQALEDAQKTEGQRLADATAEAKRDADEARAEATRYKVAATHGVSSDFFDLLGSGDEETITGRAQRLAPLLGLASENEHLKAELEALRAGKPAPAAIRPIASLKPGATPDAAPTEGDAIYQALYGAN